MKYLIVIAILSLCASSLTAQSYLDENGTPYCRSYYGSASSFKADSHYVWKGINKWVTVQLSVDSTAGTGAWWCANDDSTNAIHLLPGTGGSYGDTRTIRVKGLHHYRVKGATLVQSEIE